MAERKGPSGSWLAAGVVVAVIAVAAAVASVASLLQVIELQAQLGRMEQSVDRLQTQLIRHVNTSEHQEATEKQEDSEERYEYDDEDNTYDYDDGEEEEVEEEEEGIGEGSQATKRTRRDVAKSEPVTLRGAVPNVEEQRRNEGTNMQVRHGRRHANKYRNSHQRLVESVSEELEARELPNDWTVAHFVGDTTRYDSRTHTHYYGNHKLYHPSGIFKDWTPARWMSSSDTKSQYSFVEGKVTVHKPGIYFFYAQIYYLAANDGSGFHIKHNNVEVAQCIITSTGHSHNKRNTCFTALVLELQFNDNIWTSEIEGHRNTSFKSSHSFFGLVLLKPH